MTGPTVANSTARSLVIGGEPRAGTDHVALDALATRAGHVYDEVLLQPALESLADVWLTLRHAAGLLSERGVLTAHAGGRLASHHVLSDLCLLCRLTPIRTDETPAGVRVRARRRIMHERPLSCSVIVPCRNEEGNIAELVRRVPTLGRETELIFVDGDSTDRTRDIIAEQIAVHPERTISLLRQAGGKGKASAVFQGFDAAAGDAVLILDADMTVAPEDLPRFVAALAEDVADFANGNRFVFPMEAEAMPPLNQTGNRAFSRVLSLALRNRVGDTLCGTKAMSRRHWQEIRAVRGRFGGHDPWGDFDLLFGAAACGLRIVDVPVPYFAREAGESKMRPFVHGVALGRATGQAALALWTMPHPRD